MISSTHAQFKRVEVKGIPKTFRRPLNDITEATDHKLNEETPLNEVKASNFKPSNSSSTIALVDELSCIVFRFVFLLFAHTKLGEEIMKDLSKMMGMLNITLNIVNRPQDVNESKLSDLLTLNASTLQMAQKFTSAAVVALKARAVATFKTLLGKTSFASTSITLRKSEHFRVKVSLPGLRNVIVNLPFVDVYDNDAKISNVTKIVSKMYPGLVIFKVFVVTTSSGVKKFSQVRLLENIKTVKKFYKCGPSLSIHLKIVPHRQSKMSRLIKSNINIPENCSIIDGRKVLSSNSLSYGGTEHLSLIDQIRDSLDKCESLPRFLIVNVEGVTTKASRVLLRTFTLKSLYYDEPEKDLGLSYFWRAAITTDKRVIIAHVTAQRESLEATNGLMAWSVHEGEFIQEAADKKDYLNIAQIIYELY